MSSKIIEKYCEMPVSFRRPMWKIWHKLLIRFDKDSSVNFMNYGYVKLNEEKGLELNLSDEINRYCIQLYDHVTNRVSFTNKKILEVGSGRGGGASYLARYKKPKFYTALDISSSIIDFCNNFYQIDGLQFVKGHAEDLPFLAKSFDVVVNVESARCYKSLEVFFNEVIRVLRPKGHFCFADMISNGEVGEIRRKLRAAGLNILHEEEITSNVAEALDRDSRRREKEINNKVPMLFKSAFAQFAGTKGTERYASFMNGKFQYWSFVLQKD